jgi:hypothetical protein
MTADEFTEVSARCEALSRLVLHMAAQMEDSGLMDGHRLQEGLLAGLPHGSPVLDRSAELIRELVAKQSAARATRRARALLSENLDGRNHDG